MTRSIFSSRAWGCLAAAATLVLFAHAGAQAAPTTWTLSNVAFDDGATAAGSFDYDADTNLYSSVDVTLSGGTLYPSFHFTTGNVNFRTDSDVSFCSTGTGCADANYVYLVFESALTTISPGAGPTAVALVGHSYGLTDSGGFITSSYGVTSGSVVANAPEPSSLVLAGLAMLATVAVGARRSTARVAW